LVRRKMENASKHVLPLYVARITERAQRGRVELEALRLEDQKTERVGGGVGGAWTADKRESVDGGQEGELGERQNRIDGVRWRPKKDGRRRSWE
jgi:hypothetical protein